MEVKVGPCLCGEPEKVVEENGKQVMYRCRLYIKLAGPHPQEEGKRIDEWNCAIAWLPILQIEAALFAKQGTAAINSMRNEMVIRANASLAIQARQLPLGLVDPSDDAG